MRFAGVWSLWCCGLHMRPSSWWLAVILDEPTCDFAAAETKKLGGNRPRFMTGSPPLRSQSLGDPARWRNGLQYGEFFYIESCQWTFNKATIMKIGDAPDGREPHHPFNARICAAKPRCQQRTERPPMIRKVALADLIHPAFTIGKDVRQIVRGGRE